jgi:hypothetical protein
MDELVVLGCAEAVLTGWRWAGSCHSLQVRTFVEIMKKQTFLHLCDA